MFFLGMRTQPFRMPLYIRTVLMSHRQPVSNIGEHLLAGTLVSFFFSTIGTYNLHTCELVYVYMLSDQMLILVKMSFR